MVGWIKLPQDIFDDDDIVLDDALFKTWIFCLVSAVSQPTKIKINVGRAYREINLQRGQFVLQRYISSKTINMSPDMLRHKINKLSQLGKITKNSATHFSVISVINYDSYNGPITTFRHPKQRSATDNNVLRHPKEQNHATQKEEKNGINSNNCFLETENSATQNYISLPHKIENSANLKNLPLYEEYNNIELTSFPKHSFINDFYMYIKSKFGNKCPQLTDHLIQKSQDILDKLIRIDGFEFDYIHDVLVFAHKDKFWRDKVLSLAGLRVKGKDGITKFQKIAMSYERHNEKHRPFGKNHDIIKEMLEHGEERLEGVHVGNGEISW